MDRAVEEDVLAPGEVRMETGAELEQRADAAADLDAAGRRLMIPESSRSSVVLPEPLRPTRPTALARLDVERDVSQRPDVRGRAPAAGDDAVLQPRALARIDLEVPRGMLGAISPGRSRLRGYREHPRTSPRAP